MIRYRNLNGDSGIAGYETGADFIRIVFRTGSVYLWTVASAGRLHIERMTKLADAGRGLNTYINRWVRKAFARRER